VTHVAADPKTLLWGRLPCAVTGPVASVAPGEEFTVDTLSHEGALEDQGRDPVAFFGRYGIAPEAVLPDLRAAVPVVPHDPGRDGPHFVTGPVHVDGAAPGDLLQIDIVKLERRTDYGVVTNRHAKDVFAPEPAQRPASVAAAPVTSTFCRVVDGLAVVEGDMRLRVPVAPFLGIVGIAVPETMPPHSGPPGRHGGNIDLRRLITGTSLYLPVLVPGALLFIGDPHFVQGNGEVASTALEAPLCATLRVWLHPGAGSMAPAPLARTVESWIVCGLDRDLGRAVRAATASASDLLAAAGVAASDRLAWLSIAGEVEVTQVVDGVLGAHIVLPRTPGLDLVPFEESP
jgi:acetamidase/formamidase